MSGGFHHVQHIQARLAADRSMRASLIPARLSLASEWIAHERGRKSGLTPRSTCPQVLSYPKLHGLEESNAFRVLNITTHGAVEGCSSQAGSDKSPARMPSKRVRENHARAK
jgi:hypothetical protein